MNQLQELALVVIAFYLIECFRWIPRGLFVLRGGAGRWLTRRYEIAPPSSVAGNQHGGLIFKNPLLPFRPLLVCGRWPVSLGQEGLCAAPAQGMGIEPPPSPHAGQFIAYKQIRNIGQEDGAILLNDETVAQAGDALLAEFFGSTIADITRAPDKRRQTLIDAELRRHTRVRGVRRDLLDYYRRTSFLRMLSFVQWVLLLFYLPAAAWYPPLWQHSLQFVALLGIYHVAILISFYIAHRRLFPQQRAYRWRALVTMLILPTDAIFAADAIARQLLLTYHPLAAAAALCKAPRFHRYARQFFLDLTYPKQADVPLDAKAEETIEDFRHRLKTALTATVKERGESPAELVAAPAREDPTYLAYCPRCDTQYLKEEGQCKDCEGISLRKFPAITDERRAPVELNAAVASTSA